MAKTFVIIDDEAEMEELYHLMLEEAIEAGKINVRFFSQSVLFLEWFNHNHPDLIFCDINMPDISGIEVAKHIQRSGKKVSTYFVSGHEEADYKQVMNDVGVQHYLPKPFDYHQVIQILENELQIPIASH